MLAHCRTQIGFRRGNPRFFFPLLDPASFRIPNNPQITAPFSAMAIQTDSTKRPICSSCSKPKRTCLCDRFPTRSIDNSVAVTILQHSIEKKHPLNSARIATIGLKNVNLVTVSDVCFESHFSVELLTSDSQMVQQESHNDRNVFDEMASSSRFFFSIGKYGAVISINDHLLGSLDSTRGFLVRKIQRNPLKDKTGYEETKEFEITVPPRSVLLFPSENSVDIEAIDFQVKNLIVLDGTWAKAKRMYNENPWLKLLPHVKLNMEETSLYREVRHQPCPDYLSTIESIVYAIKALGGDDLSDLDGLLDVFESMIGDQRQCKDERLKTISENRQ